MDRVGGVDEPGEADLDDVVDRDAEVGGDRLGQQRRAVAVVDVDAVELAVEVLVRQQRHRRVARDRQDRDLCRSPGTTWMILTTSLRWPETEPRRRAGLLGDRAGQPRARVRADRQDVEGLVRLGVGDARPPSAWGSGRSATARRGSPRPPARRPGRRSTTPVMIQARRWLRRTRWPFWRRSTPECLSTASPSAFRRCSLASARWRASSDLSDGPREALWRPSGIELHYRRPPRGLGSRGRDAEGFVAVALEGLGEFGPAGRHDAPAAQHVDRGRGSALAAVGGSA